jgi:hypothetical protein
VVAEDTLQKYWLSPKGKDPESWVNWLTEQGFSFQEK